MKSTRTRGAADVDEYVGQQIRQRHTLTGITQKMLAEALGVSFQQRQKYEWRKNRISASRLYRLAGIFGCAPESFFQTASSEIIGRYVMRRETIILVQAFENMSGSVRRSFLRLVRDVAAERRRNVGNVPRNAHPRIRQLVDYWLSIHPPRDGLPGLQHLDPVDIPWLLPNIRLIEVHRDPLRFRFRLVGTRYCEVAGHDPTGQWLHEASRDFEGTPAYGDLEAVVTGRAPRWNRGKPTGTIRDKDYVVMERVHLPLAHDGRNVDMILSFNLIGDKNEIW